MPPISRRDFLKSAATCTAAAGFLSTGAIDLRANPLGMPIGCQTWPVREMIAKDFPATIKELAAAGFETIELCSPVGYGARKHSCARLASRSPSAMKAGQGRDSSR